VPPLSAWHRPAPQKTSPFRSLRQSADATAGIANSIANSPIPAKCLEEPPLAVIIKSPEKIACQMIEGTREKGCGLIFLL
jgi:hypothetical protein